MKKIVSSWKSGRGKLGVLAPLIGKWEARAQSPLGSVRCSRTFSPILSNKYVQLNVQWKFKRGVYEEHAIFGVKDGKLVFWSFTSDGKHSQGTLADVRDVHPQAIGFQAQMPAGLGRMAFWPNENGGFNWAVEAKTKKGWTRFTEHHYMPV